jgi:hypothetical protein
MLFRNNYGYIITINHLILHKKSSSVFLLAKCRTEALDATKNIPKNAEIS